MVTLWFNPGDHKLQVAAAIKRTIHINLREVRDALELQRVQCEESDREKLIQAIEDAGGKIQ